MPQYEMVAPYRSGPPRSIADPDRSSIDVSDIPVRIKFRNRHLVGSPLTYADMNVIPMLSALLNFAAGKDTLAKYSSLSAYVTRLADLPSFKNTAPPPRRQSQRPRFCWGLDRPISEVDRSRHFDRGQTPHRQTAPAYRVGARWRSNGAGSSLPLTISVTDISWAP
jgi:glutathione S-transferase-like protein